MDQDCRRRGLWIQRMFGIDSKIIYDEINTCKAVEMVLINRNVFYWDVSEQIREIMNGYVGQLIIIKVKLSLKIIPKQISQSLMDTSPQKTAHGTSKLGKTRQQLDYISYDAPPLDFSYKNIVNLQQIKSIEPRQGHKHSPEQQQQKQQRQQSQQEHIEEQQASKQQKKQQIMKLLPQNNINSVVNTLVNTSAMKNISSKAKEQLEKKKKKAVNIKLVCCSIMLGYNKVRQINQFPNVIKTVMTNWDMLQWVDLSHNYLMKLDYDFADFPSLKTLYLHCNYLYSFEELIKLSHLKDLKNFTIHGNSLTAVGNFRLLVISILPQLKKLDSVLISKKERDNAVFIRSQTKKFPQPKIRLEPPTQKKAEEQEEKQ